MSTPLVFKFGGASVKDAQSVRNVARIIGQFSQRPMVVVVSAMGKMTNAFEEVVAAWSNGNLSEANAKIDAIATFHQDIINELFEDPTEINGLTILKKFSSLIFDNSLSRFSLIRKFFNSEERNLDIANFF